MTDDPQNPDDSIRDPFAPDAADGSVEAVFVARRCGPAAEHPTDPFDPGLLFLWWALETGFRDWKDAVRALARALRGLERLGFIDRRTIRRPGHPTHHGFVLTDEGREALVALSGDSIRGPER